MGVMGNWEPNPLMAIATNADDPSTLMMNLPIGPAPLTRLA